MSIPTEVPRYGDGRASKRSGTLDNEFEVRVGLPYIDPMYQCRTQPITGAHSHAVLRTAYAFLKQWKRDTGVSPPGLPAPAFDNELVLLNWFRSHTDAKISLPNKVRRYRLLPCARELLENSTDQPFRAANGNYVLHGLTPDGLEFRVVIKPVGQDLRFITCYPRT
jgi:hypothetical protein